MEQIIEIPLDRIKPSPFNPRRSLPDIAGLKASIDAAGILEPLIVRPVSIDVTQHHSLDGDPINYEMVNGHRRLAAACDLATVPCIVRELTDAQAKQVQLVTALQRENLHPYDEAVVIGDLLAANENDFPKVGTVIGKHVTYVRRRAVLLRLIPAAATAFKANKFGLDVAFLLARATPETQKGALADSKDRGEMTVANVEWFCSQRFTNLKEAPWDLDDGLSFSHAGSCTECPKQSNNQTSLFDDKSEKNLCLDAVCFKKKLAIHVASVKKNDPNVVLVRQSHLPRGMDELAPDAYIVPADKSIKCKSLKPALIIDGGYKKTTVCTDPKCKVHSAPSVKATPERKAELKRQRDDKAIAAEVYRALIIPGGEMDDRDWRTVANFMWDRTWGDARKTYLSYHNFDLQAHISLAVKDGDLSRLLLGFALMDLINPRTAAEALEHFQKVYKDRLDMAEIKKRVSDKESKPKETKPKPIKRKKGK